MRIMHVLPTLNIGGAEKLVVSYLIEMKNLGHEVCLYVKTGEINVLYEKLTSNNIKVYFLKEKKIRLVKKILERLFYWNSIKEFSPDIMHFHLGMIPKIKDRRRYEKIKLYYTYHSDIERYIKIFGKNWKKNLCWYLENNLIKSFAISKEMLKCAKTKMSKKNIYYLPNGIDILKFSKNKYSKKEFLKKNGLEEESFIIGHVARVIDVKNQRRSIEILMEVLKLNKKAKLIFVGKEEKKYKDELEKQINKYNLKDKVIFLGLREDVGEIISVLDTAILPSFYEGFPLTVIEYQIHGVRTIVSKAIPEEVICNKNCFRLDLSLSNQKWSQYICGVNFHENSKDISEFDLKKIIEKLLEFYKN